MKRKLLVVALSTLLLPSVSLAGGALIGASVGQSSVEITETGVDFNASDNAFKVFGGYRFLKFFGVEGSYVDLGSPDDDVGGTNVAIDTTAWDAFAVGVIPIAPLFEVFGKVGFVWWDADLKASGSPTDSDSGSDAAYGIGVAFKLGGLIGIRAEYERFDIEDTDNVYLASAGIDFRF